MMPRVSVILTSYNAGQYLDQAIQSVVDQTYTDWECVVMDDNSSDGLTGGVLGKWEEVNSDDRVKVWRHETTAEQRMASVRYATLINFAIRWYARGDLIVCLPGDDYFEPTALADLSSALRDFDFPAVYGKQRMIEVDGSERGYRPASLAFTSRWLPFHRVDLSQVMFSRQAFDRVGGFPTEPTSDNWRCADGHFFNKLASLGPIQPVPVVVGTKRYHDDSVDERVKAGLTPWVEAS
jgi:cellulose synthase/poly-beta-1,6-N-acetylglucosamine synthase-like glycosyltransferase